MPPTFCRRIRALQSRPSATAVYSCLSDLIRLFSPAIHSPSARSHTVAVQAPLVCSAGVVSIAKILALPQSLGTPRPHCLLARSIRESSVGALCPEVFRCVQSRSVLSFSLWMHCLVSAWKCAVGRSPEFCVNLEVSTHALSICVIPLSV